MIELNEFEPKWIVRERRTNAKEFKAMDFDTRVYTTQSGHVLVIQGRNLYKPSDRCN